MSLNLADSAGIMSAYEAVLANEFNWLLLHYSNNGNDELELYAFGSEGLEELKTKINPEDDETALIGFLQVEQEFQGDAYEGIEQEDENADGIQTRERRFLLVGYVPKGITGVRRARAQVNTRRLALTFKEHDAILTVEDLSQLTNDVIAKTLAEPDSSIFRFSTSTSIPGDIISPTPIPISPTTDTMTQESSIAFASPTSSNYYPQRHVSQPNSYIPTAVNMGRSYSQPNATTPPTISSPIFKHGQRSHPPSATMNVFDLKQIKRSFSETYAPALGFHSHSTGTTMTTTMKSNSTYGSGTGFDVNSTSPTSGGGGGGNHHKMGTNMFSNFLKKRTKRSASTGTGIIGTISSPNTAILPDRDTEESQDSDDSMPPPTPPKDKGAYAPVAAPGHGRIDKGKGREMDIQEDVGRYSPPPHQYRHGHHGQEYTLYESPSEDEINGTGRDTHLGNTRRNDVSGFNPELNVSEFAVVSHENVDDGRGMRIRRDGNHTGHGHEHGYDLSLRHDHDERDTIVIQPEVFGFNHQRNMEKPLPSVQTHVDLTATLKKGKWAGPQGLAAIKDPAERARMRMELQKQKEEEEKEVIRLEEERQERLRRRKVESLRREEEAAEQRKAEIQAEAARVAAERRRIEAMERLEEEKKEREREERRRFEKQRRMEEHLRLEEWRKEQQRVAEEHAREEEESKKREEEEWREKVLKAKSEVKRKANKGEMVGWVTVQTNDSMLWKRRYYKFLQDTLYLFKNQKDMVHPMDILHLKGSVRALKEPKDGYEDLDAIPYSFAVEFNDRGPWSMFADSEEEKFKLLGLLQHAST